jgi:hypothetical protein
VAAAVRTVPALWIVTDEPELSVLAVSPHSAGVKVPADIHALAVGEWGMGRRKGVYVLVTTLMGQLPHARCDVYFGHVTEEEAWAIAERMADLVP